jgi:iron(III) transport system ATP-binding protein
MHPLVPGQKVRIALRPEKIAIGKADGANTFAARVIDRRYQGTQTVYDIDLFGHRLEALELGTAARHQVGVETEIALPKEAPVGLPRHRAVLVRLDLPLRTDIAGARRPPGSPRR